MPLAWASCICIILKLIDLQHYKVDVLKMRKKFCNFVLP